MTFLQSTKPSFRGNETQKKFQGLDENHGLAPLEKWRFSYYVKTRFLQSTKPFFLTQGIIKQHVKVFLKENKNEKKFQIFDENHALSASIALTKVILHAQQNCTGYRSHVFSVRLQRVFCIFGFIPSSCDLVSSAAQKNVSASHFRTLKQNCFC